ncbi:hypothetical protein [Silvanigrella aquatica]|uniref:Uncharacterized protein n=1 Tax=Silvanigrella aquatica TaxID=1915309 RepID=A0A1L4CYM2_9BACT|nr:hypothetical protein [Silvanigrella aquatica]APJ03048.1 hypothetical protein AXG55_03630 [Silvanigrella aquatica]
MTASDEKLLNLIEDIRNEYYLDKLERFINRDIKSIESATLANPSIILYAFQNNCLKNQANNHWLYSLVNKKSTDGFGCFNNMAGTQESVTNRIFNQSGIELIANKFKITAYRYGILRILNTTQNSGKNLHIKNINNTLNIFKELIELFYNKNEDGIENYEQYNDISISLNIINLDKLITKYCYNPNDSIQILDDNNTKVCHSNLIRIEKLNVPISKIKLNTINKWDKDILNDLRNYFQYNSAS